MSEQRAIMTISVDQELRRRIQKHPEVNWSEVAREAFNGRLVKMEQSQNMKLGKGTIARLLASRQRSENEDRSLGYEAGKRWAEHSAEWSELRDLARAQNEATGDDDAADVLYAAYKHELDASELTEWVGNELGEGYSDDMVWGFIEGALAIYEAMENA